MHSDNLDQIFIAFQPHDLFFTAMPRRFDLHGQPANQCLFTFQRRTRVLQQFRQMQVIGQPPFTPVSASHSAGSCMRCKV